ncbi:Phloem protein [Parasponia andersonii]|uniref:Phloem protein n=1 Tax=Parasponia andersonii TaxID=3476 RepID=A0A2P5DTF8_PARAD|nr:Phloem protein [Parasponia andersonii]
MGMGETEQGEADKVGGCGGEEEEEEEEEEAVDCFYVLPEGCIANIVSLTSPRDACRLCLVSSVFRSAAESDTVWERFLPPQCLSVLDLRSRGPRPSKKDLYFSLCNQPLLIDEGKKSFSLEKATGKKCYMLSARTLSIVWGDTPTYWRWIPLPEARFDDVAELIGVCWFEVRGKIDIRMLSPSTLYTANLVFKLTGAYGFEHQPVDARVGLVGGETSTRVVYLDTERGRRQRFQIVPRLPGLFFRNRAFQVYETSPPREVDNTYNGHEHPKERGDGWIEVELGEFYYDGRQEGELEVSVLEVSGGNWKGGLIVQGIEIRPKKV